LIANMVLGVTQGFKKELDVVGVGFKAQLKGKSLLLNVGFSHPVDMPIPEGLKVTTPIQTRIVIEGYDRYVVGQFAANVRAVWPPEPYKGKGIRYVGEEVRKKLGKALAK
jgi:large subunit ribosomal protein L6